MQKMHDDEIAIDDRLVRRLLAAQFPEWSSLALERVDSVGTVNALFRLGHDMVVRLPRTPRWHDIDSEASILRRIAPRVPLAVPRVLALGEPAHEYPWKWGIFRWIDGETWSAEGIEDLPKSAHRLAEFVGALQAIDPSDGPPSAQEGSSMVTFDRDVQSSARAAGSMIDIDRFLAVWDQALEAPGWKGRRVWVHADLLAANVITRNGELHAVIDWAGAHVGDPARDLTPAWMLFEEGSRKIFRAALPFDDATWMRARAWALMRIHNVAYYAKTNPRFSADAIATIERVLAEA